MTVRLRPPSPSPPPPGEESEGARRLRLRAGTRRFVAFLREDPAGSAIPPGRYNFLTQAIAQRPQLLDALLRGHDEAICREWKGVVAARQADPAFLRGLALLNFEQALSAEDIEIATRAWKLSTALWATLYCGGRLQASSALDVGEAIDGILDIHGQLGARHLAAGRHERAAIHAHSLRLCADGEEAIVQALYDYALDVRLTGSGRLASELADRAEQRLDHWAAAIVGEAESAADDPDALSRGEAGLRRNYAGAIARLEPFLALDVRSTRALLAALKLCNDWADDLHVAKREGEHERVLTRAGQIADRLAPLCAEGDALSAANQALARHYADSGFHDADAVRALASLRRALVWNPDSTDARKLLIARMRTGVIAHVEREEWAQAEALATASDADAESVAELRAVIRFRQAVVLADRQEFSRALDLARQAAALWDQDGIRDLLDQLERIAPEEENAKRLDQAQEALEAKRFAEAVRLANSVPSHSTLLAQARQIRRNARVSDLNDVSERGNLERAEPLLRDLIASQDGPAEETAALKVQLSHVLNARGVKLANDGQQHYSSITSAAAPSEQHVGSDVVAARQTLVLVLCEAERMIAEAVAIDSRNKDAKSNLKAIRKLIDEFKGG